MSKKDYEVGDCKPPVEHQFKKGQSGNPKGRPKGTKNLKTDLAEELAERVSINENGKQRKVSKQRLMLKSQITKAIKGDTRAADLVVRTMAQTLGLDAEDQTAAPLGADDVAIIEQHFSDLTSARQRKSKESDHGNEQFD